MKLFSKSYLNKYEPVVWEEWRDGLLEPHKYKLLSVENWLKPSKFGINLNGADLVYNFLWSKSYIFILHFDFFILLSVKNIIFFEYKSILYNK